MSLLYVLAFGLPWILLIVWGIKIVVCRYRFLRQRDLFDWSSDATERYGKYYSKKYKGIEVGEYDG